MKTARMGPPRFTNLCPRHCPTGTLRPSSASRHAHTAKKPKSMAVGFHYIQPYRACVTSKPRKHIFRVPAARLLPCVRHNRSSPLF